MRRRTRTARALALAGHLGLILHLLTWFAWLAPPETFPVAAAIVLLVGPLLLPLRGLLHGRPYTHAWTAMLALAYFLHGLMVALSMPELRLLGAVEAALSLVLYGACIAYSRFRGTELGTAAG